MLRPEGPTHVGHIIHLLDYNAATAADHGEDLAADDLMRVRHQLAGIAAAHLGYDLDALNAGRYEIGATP